MILMRSGRRCQWGGYPDPKPTQSAIEIDIAGSHRLKIIGSYPQLGIWGFCVTA